MILILSVTSNNNISRISANFGRKQIRELRVEAETQNLLNSNRQLKSKLEEAKRMNAQMKKEGEKSKITAANGKLISQQNYGR